MGKEIAIKVMVLYNHYRVFNRFLTPYELKTAIAREVGIPVSLVEMAVRANGGAI